MIQNSKRWNRGVAICLLAALLGVACVSKPGPSLSREGKTYDRYLGIWVYGFRRGYRVHIPPRRAGHPALPLVIAIHGAFDSPKNFADVTGLDEIADRSGFVVAYPAGFAPPLRTWNAGHCCGMVRTLEIDDVGYIDAVIRDAREHLPIDPTRIYLVGHSNGGMLVHRFLAERPGRVAAAAVVAGTIGGRPNEGEMEWRIPTSSARVPLLLVHGVMDEQVAYYGGPDSRNNSGRTWISARESALHWSDNPECLEQSVTLQERRGWVRQEVWTGSPNCRVELHSLHGWGHRWPSSRFTNLLETDHPLHGFEVSDTIMHFFRESSAGAVVLAATSPPY